MAAGATEFAEYALAAGASAGDSGEHAVAIVYPGSEGRAGLIGGSGPPSARWMSDVVEEVALDPRVGAVTDSLATLAEFKQATVDGRERLVVISHAEAGSLADAVLVVAVLDALDVHAPVTELERESIADAVLAGWQRPTSEPMRDLGAGGSAGRWLWAAVLLLIAVETLARRRAAAGRRGDAAVDAGQPVKATAPIERATRGAA
jgi:hypothetical protein